ncbi:MAG: GTP-binding protein [Psychromonas sp.]
MKQKIPCHIIAGFLGSGKSLLIKQLLSYKPADEKWAVLVNEIGNNKYPQQLYLANNIFIKEVYGGCLCCSAGMPFAVALNKLIKDVRPDRLFIEPAGAGHLANIQKLLRNQFYQPVLQLKETLCIVSSEQVNDKKYYDNESYLSLISHSDRLCINANSTIAATQQLAKHYDKSFYPLQQNRHDLALIL